MMKPALHYLISILLLFIYTGNLSGLIQLTTTYSVGIQDNNPGKRFLLNGRIWRNAYSNVTGDQFFLVNNFLKGSVTLDGVKFDELDLKYDIHNDELILRTESHPVIFMNKEMVDSFSLVYGNRSYKIINTGTGSPGVLRGYVNVLYEGSSSLYVKYTKKIHPLADGGKYDLFVEEHFIYIGKDTEIIPVNGKRKFMSLLEDKRKEVRDYMRNNRIKVIWKNPQTFIPILLFYDSIRK